MANTYTSDLGAQEGRIASLTQAVSQGYTGLSGINDSLRKALYEREKTLPGLEKENESKIQELYTADKRYAERYANPESEMYIENPMQRQALVSGQKADIRGEWGNILNLIQQRSQTLGNAIDKGMELYKYGLEAQKVELEAAEKQWDRIMEKAKLEESKKGSGTNYSAYQQAFNAWAQSQQPTEPKPAFSPVDKNATSKGGQWKYDVNTGDWVPTNQQAALANSLAKASSSNPQVGAVALSNMGDFFPEPKTESLTQTEEFRADISAVAASVSSGKKTFEEGLQALTHAYPEKDSINIMMALNNALY